MESEPQEEKTIIYAYLQEVFEAFVSILILQFAMGKSIDYSQIVKASFAIGVLTFLLEKYNPDFKSNITQGITFTVGSQIMTRFS